MTWFSQLSRDFRFLVLASAVSGLSLTFTAKPGSAMPKAQPSNPLVFRVTLDKGVSETPVSGRLVVLFAKQNVPLGLSFGPHTRDVWITARDVRGLRPGETVELGPSADAFPGPPDSAPEGDYNAVAVLDVNSDLAYRGSRAGDFQTPVVHLKNLKPGSASNIMLTLTQRVSEELPRLPPRTEIVEFVSPSLSAFWKKPIRMRAAVVLPPDYQETGATKRQYPSVFLLHGFSTSNTYLIEGYAAQCAALSSEGKIPPWIHVVLDQTCPGGTHEFVDSANNGPWGTALTSEFIPYLESRYRMDRRPERRFLTGHSSGGWAALWLQIAYPSLFGGAWATSPDPVDFRQFLGVDLVGRPAENFYHDQDHRPRPFMRQKGEPVQWLEDGAKQEAVLGGAGGQLASFEWVFSPRGVNGRPLPLFDRQTGRVFPDVAQAWQKYDLSAVVKRNWKAFGPQLIGKLHVTVGEEDPFYLDRPARLLERTLDDLGARASITYQPTQAHVGLFMNGNLERFEQEMLEAADPSSVGSKRGLRKLAQPKF